MHYYQHVVLFQVSLHQLLHIHVLLQLVLQLILTQVLHLMQVIHGIFTKILDKLDIYLKIFIVNQCMKICIISNITIQNTISEWLLTCYMSYLLCLCYLNVFFECIMSFFYLKYFIIFLLKIAWKTHFHRIL